jgi:hypothetical protein
MGMYGWHDNDLYAFNVVVDNDLTIKGTLTFGDAATDNLIIKGRMSSMTAAGSAIQITSSYAYGEGIEMRYQVTDWTGVGSSFKGMYLRSEAITTAATGKSIYGAEIYGVCNNVTMTTGSLWGALFYAYVKGVGAVTVNNMYAVQGELTWDASRTHDCTITTAAACFRAKITGGRVADYTKIHGYELTIGEMDGDSAKFGKGLFMQDDSGMSGTCTLTTGIDIAIGCTTGISIGGTCSTAGLFLGATNKISFHDSNIYMRASADGHFEIVSDDTITLSVPGSGHGGIVFGGETDWGTGATGPDLDGTGWDWVTQTVGRVNTENVTAAAYAAQYNALTVTKGQNLTSSFFGTWTELYISPSITLASSSNYAAVWGQVELGATVTSTDSEDFMAAVYGNFKTGATFTNNTKVCGFLAQSEVATSGLTNNGTISAYYAMKKSGCQVWDHGLFIADDASTTGIQIGNATTGILLDGDFTTGIDINAEASLTDAIAIDAEEGATITTGINMTCTTTGTITTGISMSWTAAATEGIAMTITTGDTITRGMSMSGAGTYTTGILLDATAITTAIQLSAGSMTDAILIDGTTPVDGIHISSACSAMGINISGICATGLSMTNASTVGLLISAGPMGFDLTSTLPAGAAANANEINFTDDSTGSSGYARALWINATVAGDKTGSGEHNSLGIDQHVTGNSPYLYGMTYYSYDTGDPTIGFAAPISIYQDDLGTGLGAWVGIDIGSNFTNAPAGRHAFLRCRNHNAAAVPNCIIQCEGAGGATYLLNVDAQGNMLSASSAATTVVEKIAVKTPGGTRYVKLYSDA